jgi:hypothetical protein
MGGKAIVDLINKPEADRITLEQKYKYLQIFNHTPKLRAVREIHEKETFGDIDLLYAGNEKIDFFVKKFQDTGYQYNGQVKNSTITSLAIGTHQIDVIRVSEAKLEIACHYFNDNDKGNLIGVIYNRLGFIYGHEGLYLRMDFDKLFLSDDIHEILKFIKYNPSVIDKSVNFGFETYQEMFEMVTSSPYFDSEYYRFENLNNENRTRNKKRKTYQMFVDYLETRPKKSLIFSKEMMRYQALSFFGKEKEYIKLLKEKENNKLNKLMINGDIITKITGYEREELGKFIVFLKKEEPFMMEYAYYYQPEEIEKKIKNASVKYMEV